MIRLFAAVAVPPDVAEALSPLQAGLRGARWREAEHLHVTLRFFGEVQETVAEDIDSALAVIAAPRLSLAAAGVGAFGEGERIHAVWAGIDDNPDLQRLAKACEAAARSAGLKPEARNYLPHITLAYMSRPDPAEVARWIAANNLLRLAPFEARSFGLYSSWRGERGSSYRLERSYVLA